MDLICFRFGVADGTISSAAIFIGVVVGGVGSIVNVVSGVLGRVVSDVLCIASIASDLFRITDSAFGSVLSVFGGILCSVFDIVDSLGGVFVFGSFAC